MSENSGIEAPPDEAEADGPEGIEFAGFVMLPPRRLEGGNGD